MSSGNIIKKEININIIDIQFGYLQFGNKLNILRGCYGEIELLLPGDWLVWAVRSSKLTIEYENWPGPVVTAQ